MDAVIKKLMPQSAYLDKPETDRPSQEEVEAAVRTLLRWTGDNPDREGLIDTPRRVAKAYREMFGGYDMCPAEELGRTVSGTITPFAFHPALEVLADPALLDQETLYFNAARLDCSVALGAEDYLRVAQPRVVAIT